MKKICSMVFAAVILLFAGACTVRQDITLQAGGAGTASLEAELHPVFMEYYADLASGFSSSFDPEQPRFFNAAAIREAFHRNAALRLDSLQTPSPGKLVLRFHITDISGAIKNEDKAAQNIISRTQNGNRETLAIRLSRSNLASLLKIIPEMDSPVAKMLLPPEGATEEDYAEHLAWALEDYAKNEKIEDILKASAIYLSIRTPRKILSQTGGSLKNENEAGFRISLPGLFTLEKALEYSVTY
ncbi:MAG: hypothetical protein LBQ57_11510 [Spirochaetales bacterium]|jgi:hypothetical protein|nr:hypothetical protein [Spirochaetales bacterium]